MNFYVILTETKYIDTPINNVSYCETAKKYIKSKLLRPTDVEIEPYNFVSRKLIGVLDLIELSHLLDDTCVQFEANTMGAITEYGMLEAINLTYLDYYTNQETSIYLSLLPPEINIDEILSETNQNLIVNTYHKNIDILFEGLKENKDIQFIDFLEYPNVDSNQLALI